MIVVQIIAAILALAGFVFMVISTIGIIRFPDFYSRLHAAGVGDTLGAMLITLAMILLAGFKLLSLKILVIWAIISLTGPLGTNLIMMSSIRKKNFQKYNELTPIDEAEKEGK